MIYPLEDMIVEDSSGNPNLKTNHSSDALNHGSLDVSTAGTAENLPSQTCRGVIITAKGDNTGAIYLGDSSVSSSSYGVKLSAGDETTLPVSNIDLIYIDADTGGEGITYLAY